MIFFVCCSQLRVNEVASKTLVFDFCGYKLNAFCWESFIEECNNVIYACSTIFLLPVHNQQFISWFRILRPIFVNPKETLFPCFIFPAILFFTNSCRMSLALVLEILGFWPCARSLMAFNGSRMSALIARSIALLCFPHTTQPYRFQSIPVGW